MRNIMRVLAILYAVSSMRIFGMVKNLDGSKVLLPPAHPVYKTLNDVFGECTSENQLGRGLRGWTVNKVVTEYDQETKSHTKTVIVQRPAKTMCGIVWTYYLATLGGKNYQTQSATVQRYIKTKDGGEWKTYKVAPPVPSDKKMQWLLKYRGFKPSYVLGTVNIEEKNSPFTTYMGFGAGVRFLNALCKDCCKGRKCTF